MRFLHTIYLSLSDVISRQEGGKATLQHVRVATNSVSSITIVGAFAVEAEVVGRRHKESLQDIAFCDVIDFRRHVEHSADHGHGTAETKEPETTDKEGMHFY